jgi:RNA 2',3'-cyclic 3'-phosphodiesterase
MPAAGNRRLFFALWPTSTVREQLASQVQLHAALGRAIPDRNLHLTVVFLGAIPQQRVASVMEVARQVQNMTSLGNFIVHLDRVEFWRRSSLVCLTTERASAELLAMSDSLRAGLRERGFELSGHEKFRPHVTLVRDVTRDPGACAALAPVEWPVESFALVESQVGERGSQYTVLEEWKLN